MPVVVPVKLFVEKEIIVQPSFAGASMRKKKEAALGRTRRASEFAKLSWTLRRSRRDGTGAGQEENRETTG